MACAGRSAPVPGAVSTEVAVVVSAVSVLVTIGRSKVTCTCSVSESRLVPSDGLPGSPARDCMPVVPGCSFPQQKNHLCQADCKSSPFSPY